jgi:ribosome-associated toxin RatA of RatAB toxin-antitoxin module
MKYIKTYEAISTYTRKVNLLDKLTLHIKNFIENNLNLDSSEIKKQTKNECLLICKLKTPQPDLSTIFNITLRFSSTNKAIYNADIYIVFTHLSNNWQDPVRKEETMIAQFILENFDNRLLKFKDVDKYISQINQENFEDFKIKKEAEKYNL